MVKDNPGPANPTRVQNMPSLQLLRLARDTVQRSWCQGSNALNAAGLPVSPLSSDACSWCFRGAIIKALNPSFSVLSVDLCHDASPINKEIAQLCGFETIAKMVQWNDTQGRTQEEVLQRLDSLIYMKERPHGKKLGREELEDNDEKGTPSHNAGGEGRTSDTVGGSVQRNKRVDYKRRVPT